MKIKRYVDYETGEWIATIGISYDEDSGREISVLSLNDGTQHTVIIENASFSEIVGEIDNAIQQRGVEKIQPIRHHPEVIIAD